MGVKVGIGWIWCSADVIRSLRCLRYDPYLRTHMQRFVSEPGDTASFELFHETV